MMAEQGPAAFATAPAALGLTRAERAEPFARFLAPEDQARAEGFAKFAAPLAPGSIEPFADIAAALSRPGYLPVETGWCAMPSGPAIVAVHTPMPGVTPAMWDWWFAWHSAAPGRYKIWAPSEHLVAMWKDGEGERPGDKSYIGRTSLIKEHIGSVYLEGAIRFVDPATIGFVPGAFEGTVICGRAGEVHAPVEHTWLIHQVRATAEGAEMRSRFYLGQDPQLTTTGAPLPPPDVGAPKPGPKPAELLMHCATEMHHLAGFLPALYALYNPHAGA
jgi:hypothetical protein